MIDLIHCIVFNFLETKLHPNIHQKSSVFNQNQDPSENYHRSSYYQQPNYHADYNLPVYYPVTNYEVYDEKPKKIKDKFKKGKKEDKKEEIGDKIFTKIATKIIEKAIRSFPQILANLFGFEIEKLFDIFGDIKYNYGSEYGGDGYVDNGYGVQKGYQSLGVFGYLPVFAIRIISHLTECIKKLKKNKFLKTFLVPALVLVGTAGLILFLIWFLSDDHFDYDYYKDEDYYYDNHNYGNNYGYDNNYHADGYYYQDDYYRNNNPPNNRGSSSSYNGVPNVHNNYRDNNLNTATKPNNYVTPYRSSHRNQHSSNMNSYYSFD